MNPGCGRAKDVTSPQSQYPDTLRGIDRDFAPVVDRARAAGCAVEVYGEVEGLPLLAARVGDGEPEALLIAGTHGDEPATVEAALQVMERVRSRPAGAPGLDVLTPPPPGRA